MLDELDEPGELEFPQVFRKAAAGNPAGFIAYAFLSLALAMIPAAIATFIAADSFYLVYVLHREGVETGIDLGALIAVSTWLESLLGRRLEGQLYRAGSFPSTVER